MAGCGNCGCALDFVANRVGREAQCPHCGCELRACIHCRHHDENVAKACKEPFAEVPSDKENANFCEYFQLGEGRKRQATTSKEALLSLAESLFKKK
ncbi:MAG: hypothetical protein FWG75_02220 [Cystobacterineae bacterium]|nr:hypothetical protein [Cystobacterineae bacterium]